MSQKTIVFTGGGTGGHVYPGIAVVRALENVSGPETAVRCVWIGSKHGIERDIVARAGRIEFIGVSSGKLRRYFSVKNVVDVLRVVAGIVQSIRHLRRLSPALLFSKGGYVSVPPVLAARFLRIPIVTHESDVDPGLATRINSRFADLILISHEQTRAYFTAIPDEKLIVVGNPVRPEIALGRAERGRSIAGVGPDRMVILVLGGSQGARQINLLVGDILSRLDRRWFIIHQTGKSGGVAGGGTNYRAFDYIHEEYPDVLAAADVVICRAGAATLWELAAAGKPSIQIPLGLDASRGDQIRNARLFSELGAAVMLQNPTADQLVETLSDLLTRPETLAGMGKRASTLYRPASSQTIARILYTRIGMAGDV